MILHIKVWKEIENILSLHRINFINSLFMKFNLSLTAILLTALSSASTIHAREITSFNKGWEYSKGVMIPWGVYPNIYVQKGDTVVDLPHSFNAKDLMNDDGYYRGEGSYTKRMMIPEEWKGKRIFVKFEGAAQVADVQVNFVDIFQHKGAYNAAKISKLTRKC